VPLFEFGTDYPRFARHTRESSNVEQSKSGAHTMQADIKYVKDGPSRGWCRISPYDLTPRYVHDKAKYIGHGARKVGFRVRTIMEQQA
jgi:hypothetical protein